MPLQHRPLQDSFAVEVFGINLWEPLAPADADTLRALWSQHALVLIRRQSLSERDLVNFSALFGQVERREVRSDWRSKFQPEITMITNLRNIENQPIGGLAEGELQWHSDQAYVLHPATGAILHAIELPPQGGNTSWANLSLAWDALPAGLKQRIEGRKGIFSYAKRLGIYNSADRGNVEEIRKKTPDVAHPLVLTHPVTGRKSLYLDPTTLERIEGLDSTASDALVTELVTAATQPRFVYVHEWQVGDVIMWDNACLLHRRDDFERTHNRLMKRTTIALNPTRHFIPDGELARAA